MCIHKEEVIVYGSDWFVLEPSFATLREPGGRNYGVLCNFNCHIPNLHGLAIESLGKRQSNIGIMPLQFLTEYQPTTLLKLLCRIFILNKEETRRWLNPIDNFLPLLNWWFVHLLEICWALIFFLVCRKEAIGMRRMEAVTCISNPCSNFIMAWWIWSNHEDLRRLALNPGEVDWVGRSHLRV